MPESDYKSDKHLFDIDKMFDKYLQLVKLDKRKMPPIQVKETRRAFYGAAGQMLMCLRDEITAYTEEQAVDILEDLKNQVSEFWLTENSRKN